MTSPDGTKNFGRDGSGVVRFKPDGSAFEQFSSRGGNTWGLDITWDGQVFWTQPTSGTVFFHTVLPESVLAKGRRPWNHVVEGHDHRTEHLPADDVARAGLRADRPGRPVHRRGRVRDLRRRRMARKVALCVLHRRADAEHRAPAVREARRGELHDSERGRARADRVHAGATISGSGRSRRASGPMARSTSSISTTRPSSTTTRAGRCTVRRTPPSARIAITTSAASGGCSTSRRRSSRYRC